MPYSFAAPAETHRQSNPADELLDMVQVNGKPGPLGATQIFCNGQNISLFEPQVPASDMAQRGQKFEFTRVNPTTYNFTFRIEVPPDPGATGVPQFPMGWKSRIAHLSDLEKVIQRFPKGPNFAPFPPGAKHATGRIILIPKPDKDGMCNHILFHERRHAADVHWIIQKTFAPWVTWLDKLAVNNTRFTAKDKATLEWFIGGGSSSIYYGKYLFDLAKEVGDHYHLQTDEGAAPVYTIEKILRIGSADVTDVLLIVNVSPKSRITAINWNSPPHRCFQVASVKKYESGGSPTIIENAAVAVADWTLPDIALTQSDIDKYEKAQEVDEDDVGMSNFF